MDDFLNDIPTNEEKALFEALGTPEVEDIHIFYANYIDTLVNQDRLAKTLPDGNIVISKNKKGPFTLAHELGHVLGQIGHDTVIVGIHLMRSGGTSETNTLDASKRITVEQEKTFQGSKYAK